MIAPYGNPVDYFVKRLAEGIATIAAAFAPEPVIVRLSDFKSNEYANLIGGQRYEPHEENPMLGFRGASRYIIETFRPCFEMECQGAEVRARRNGPDQHQGHGAVRAHPRRSAARSSRILAANGLKRGENGLQLIMMCELPSQRACWPSSSSNTSTASRSAPTT